MSERCGLLACRQGCCTEKISRIHRVHTRPPFRWLLVLVVLSEGHDPRRAATWRFGSPGHVRSEIKANSVPSSVGGTTALGRCVPHGITAELLIHHLMSSWLRKWTPWVCDYRLACVADAAPSRKVVTWLILPVVICLSQRLSHACLSINNIVL